MTNPCLVVAGHTRGCHNRIGGDMAEWPAQGWRLFVCRFMIGVLFAAVMVALPIHGWGQERDVAAEFKAAKTTLTSQLKGGKKEHRLAAVAKLETYPIPDAAKLLLFQGLGSNDEEVRRASFDVLAKFTGDKEICAFLITTV